MSKNVKLLFVYNFLLATSTAQLQDKHLLRLQQLQAVMCYVFVLRW